MNLKAESILDFREYDSDNEPCIEYQVKWKGYSSKHNSWEPRDDLCKERRHRKMVHNYNVEFENKCVYKIKKYRARGFEGLPKIKEYEKKIKRRNYVLNGRHFKKMNAYSKHQEEEEEEDDDDEPKVEGVIVTPGMSLQEEIEYKKYLEEQKREQERLRIKEKQEKERKKRERERQAVPAAFLDAAAPDVKKVKLDPRKNGELKDYERLVMERDDSRFLEIPNVLHEF